MSLDSPSYEGSGVQGYSPQIGSPGVARGLSSFRSGFTWRLIPAIDRNERWIAYLQRAPGRMLLVFAVSVLIALFGVVGIDFIAALVAVGCAYAGRYRNALIALATLLLLYQNGFWVDTPLLHRLAAQEGVANQISQPLLQAGMLLLVTALFSCLLIFWHRIVVFSLFRRSTVWLVAIFLGLVLVAQSPAAAGMSRVVLWSFLMTWQPYLWFLTYALASASARERPPFWQHLGVFHPFWGSTLTPFGKGLSYLRKFEAKTPQELAVTQLKGLKLATWAFLLAASQNCFSTLVYGYLGVATFDDAFLHHVVGAPYPRYIGWTSLVAFFVEDVLRMTVFGGVIVAAARLAGFRLLRNTYRPLESRTLAEFWNRYYFYFKELLVDHFFYPAFFRYFRNHRRLRIFFATFAAACVGNLLFHFIRDIHFVADMGLWDAVAGEQSHAFYTFVLAISLGLSQLRRAPDQAAKGWLRGRLLPCLWVAAFFCVLHVFDAPLDREHSLWQRGQFLFYLVGLTT
jgi:hypothetical protein